MSDLKGKLAPVLKQQWFGLPKRTHYQAGSLAKRLGLGLRQLERHFRQEFDQSPKAWLQQQRMIYAQYVVLGTSSLKEASSELGYDNPTNFARDFKRWYGMTPSQFLVSHRRHQQKVAF